MALFCMGEIVFKVARIVPLYFPPQPQGMALERQTTAF